MVVYSNGYRRVSEYDKARFWSKVDLSSKKSCWRWTGTTQHGYGIFHFDNDTWRAHRVSSLISRNKDPGNLLVCHMCDVKDCVNPLHLFIGTEQDNKKDMFEKGRADMSGLRDGSQIPLESQRKLDEVDAKDVREMYKTGRFTYEEIAEAWNVGDTTIGRIVREERTTPE